MSNVLQALTVGVDAVCSFRDVAVAYFHFRHRLAHWAESRAARIDCVADGAFVAAEGVHIALALKERKGVDSSREAERKWSIISIAIGVSVAVVVFSAWTISRMVVGILGTIRQGKELSPQERTLRSLDWVIVTLALPIITAGAFVCYTAIGLSLAPLWYNVQGKAFSERLQNLTQVIGKAASRPFALIAYEFAAFSGVLQPSFGRTIFGKTCLVFGEPWFGDLPTFAEIESHVEQESFSSPTKEELYKIMASDHAELLLDTVKSSVVNSATKIVRIKVNGRVEETISVIQAVDTYRAYEFLRIIEGENQSKVDSFQSEDEEKSFLVNLSKNHMEQLLCPISGNFIRHPIHHAVRPDLVVERGCLDVARHEGKTHVVIGNEVYPLDSFLEDPIPAEESFREALYVRFRKIHVLEQEIDAGYRALRDPATLQTIPRMIWEDPRMSRFCCAITHEPIRFIVAPDKDVSSCYEKATLRRWLEERPNQLPPNWPAGIPFDAAHLHKDRGFQHVRDMDLA